MKFSLRSLWVVLASVISTSALALGRTADAPPKHPSNSGWESLCAQRKALPATHPEHVEVARAQVAALQAHEATPFEHHDDRGAARPIEVDLARGRTMEEIWGSHQVAPSGPLEFSEIGRVTTSLFPTVDGKRHLKVVTNLDGHTFTKVVER